MQLADLQYLMHQIGPTMPEILTIVQEESDRWELTFEDELSVQISWQEEPTRVLFNCAVGEVPRDLRESVYARLLLANALPQERLDLRFALDFPDEQVLVIGELNEPDLSLETLQDKLQAFLVCAIEALVFIAESATVFDSSVSEDENEEAAQSQLV